MLADASVHGSATPDVGWRCGTDRRCRRGDSRRRSSDDIARNRRGVCLAASGLLLVLGNVLDSVSVGPLTLLWYGLIGSGFVSLGGYVLTGAFASTSGSLVFGVLLPTAAGLCLCWIGVQYARGSERVGLEPEV
ncbi:hypothetical protein [Saliphagus sp. LR7]|uniref:hypothetical protein n=1 Tax=Saliphagus sp. LR7 TaxID=2282654 RepID=UPI000DF721A7|nr:hypothetical protein [Saliphagus sp. LR7]